MTCTAGTKLIHRKQHAKLAAFVARVWTAQWRQPFLSVCVCWAHLLAATEVAVTGDDVNPAEIAATLNVKLKLLLLGLNTP
jgi:hypothetical protein